jgi:hypothetical protein
MIGTISTEFYYYAAFTSQELLEIIQEKVNLIGISWYNWKRQTTPTVFYYAHKYEKIDIDKDALYYEVKNKSKNLTEDCAEFLIYLLEQKKGEQCNKLTQ